MKIKYSALVSDASGKLNGSVAARNRYGSYLRNKITPVNKQSPAQMQVRSLFGAISKLWGNISASARAGWEQLSKEHPYSDIFGDSRVLQGSAMFQKINMNLHKAGLPMIEVARKPELTGILQELDTDIQVVDGVLDELEVKGEFDENPTENTRVVVYATPPISAGRSFVKNDFRLIGVYEPTFTDTTSETDITADYIAVHGNEIAENTRIFTRVAVLDSISGFQGPGFEIAKEPVFT